MIKVYQKLYEKTIFSIDSYTPSLIEYALKSGFTIVNDITGLANDEVAKITAKYDATVVIMHMQGNPKDMQNNPTYEDVMIDVDNFFKQRIQKAKDFGIEKIVLDVGIGFGKTLEHNLEILNRLFEFRELGRPVLVGPSRKSFIGKITGDEPDKRQFGTAASVAIAIKNGADIVRVHDVKEMKQVVVIADAISRNGAPPF